MDTATKPSLTDQAARIEAWMARVGVTVEKHKVHAVIGEVAAVSVYEGGAVRAALVDALGEPTRDPNSSLRVALWQPTEERPFLVRCYYWFKDEHCSTCGR